MDRALVQRIVRVQERIAAAARRAGRDPAEVTLVAVSKMQSGETVAAAYAAGLRLFGENRVEEAGPKAQDVAARVAPNPPPAWHMIGHLQSRKAADVLPWASMVHSVDSVKLAARLSRALQTCSDVDGTVGAILGTNQIENWPPRPGTEALAGLSGQQAQPAEATTPREYPDRSILLEVNVSGEVSKQGFRPETLPAAVEALAALPGLRLAGLMTMAPIAEDPEAVRPIFAALRTLRDDLAHRFPALELRHLSMGMTDDFEVAIAEGATLVRIGRAIFGEQP